MCVEREISGLRKRVAVEGVQKDNGDAPPIADANNEDQATQPAETGPKREKKSLQVHSTLVTYLLHAKQRNLSMEFQSSRIQWSGSL